MSLPRLLLSWRPTQAIRTGNKVPFRETHLTMTLSYLVTHSGGFHADELLSSVILTRLFPEARIIRSRNVEWTTPAADRIIYDVGGQYDPAAGIFDHHQRGAPVR